MNVKAIKSTVESTIKQVMGKQRRANAEKVIASIDEKANGILVYLSHGCTLGEAEEIQDIIQANGLKIPEQIGNAVIYVTF